MSTTNDDMVTISLTKLRDLLEEHIGCGSVDPFEALEALGIERPLRTVSFTVTIAYRSFDPKYVYPSDVEAATEIMVDNCWTDDDPYIDTKVSVAVTEGAAPAGAGRRGRR